MKNIIINDDCFHYMQSMDDNSVDCIVTDIPYNEQQGLIKNKIKQARHFHFGVADDASGLDLQKLLSEMWRVCKGSFYIFCGLNQISEISNFFKAQKSIVRLIIWEKTNPVPLNGDKFWVYGIEVAVFGRKPKATWNLHCKNTVFRYPIAKPNGHPTPKNVKLFEELILASSNEGDTIFDPFAGSGTTNIACAHTKRNCIGIEKDPEFYALAQNRLNNELKKLSLDLF